MTVVVWVVLIWVLVSVSAGFYCLGHQDGYEKGVASTWNIDYRMLDRD